jgi:hypothetical protein
LKWISCLRVPGEGGTGQVPGEGGTGHEPVGAGAAGLPGSHTEQKREEHPLLSNEKKSAKLKIFYGIRWESKRLSIWRKIKDYTADQLRFGFY